MKLILAGLAILIILAALFFFLKSEVRVEANYESKHPGFRVSLFAESLGQITRIRFTPDGDTMLVSTLAENIYAFRLQGDAFVKQGQPFFSLKTGLPGFPPEESGLSGMVLGADFEESGDIFLLHTATAGDGILKNRVTRITYREQDGRVFGENPVQIFEGNVDSELSHQIQGGVGVMIEGRPHLIFSIGDAVNGKNAPNAAIEAGKVMLIQRDGSNPLGPRPFPAFPKIQAIGVRNSFDLAQNPFDPAKRFALGDTGTDKNDRFLYGALLPSGGAAPVDFNWNGTDQSLERPARDPNVSGNPEMVLYRWNPTETLDDIVFWKGGVGGLAESNANESLVLMSLWGKTGSTENAPGRKIALGRLTNLSGQPRLTFEDFITRSPTGAGKLGHPLGVGIDPKTQEIYFGDILEGNMYKVELK